MSDKDKTSVIQKEAEVYKLFDSEYRFATIIWDNEPVSSGKLVKLCENIMEWKKSTTYTVLKKLCDRGIMKNENAIVTSLVKKTEVQRFESTQVVERAFDGSLPQFVAAFMSGKKLAREEVDELQKLIDSYNDTEEQR